MKTFSHNRDQIRKITSFFLVLVLTVGGITACTPAQRTAGIAVTGAVIGGATGYLVSKANGADSKQALGYGLGGALIGGLAGGLLAQHLNKEEQASYDASVNQSLKKRTDDQPDTNTWKNAEGTKQITTVSSVTAPVDIASQAAQKQGIQVDSNILASANIPAESSCRMAETTLSQNGQDPIKESALWCRDSQGDYVRVGEKRVANL